MRVLGLSAHFHDAAAALVDGGRIIAAAQEERFTRKKHDASLPVAAARFCLEEAGLTAGDLDAVVFYEKPLRKLERLLVTHLRELPRGRSQFTRALGTWLGKRTDLRTDIARRLGVDASKVLFSEHHLSHAASAFYCSPFDEAAVLTVDGVGEWTTTAIFHGQSTSLRPVAELRFPHSLGLLYSALTAYLGFEVNEGEYKVMGLSAYGRPRFAAELAKVCRIESDGSVTLEPRYFAYRFDAERSFTDALPALLGPARRPGAPLDLESDEGRRFADVAASLQDLTERAMLALARRAQELTGARRLCLAGGVALNSVANRRLAEEGPFEEIFVQPAAGDAGGALGAALYVSHTQGGLPRGAPMRSASLGRAWSNPESWLRDCAVPYRRFDDPAKLTAAIADRLAAGQVGAIVTGRFEWGPRALGSRSILADPRDPAMRDRVNASVKLRESFRPFAPAVLEEDAALWFDLGAGRDRHLWPFMCSVVPATERGRATLGAVVHVDGTARLQTVQADASPRLHALLHAFKERTGVGVLLNTSFNLKDEPICASPADAYKTFVSSGLDFLALESCLIEKERPC
jgi:carbamoyltransferase